MWNSPYFNQPPNNNGGYIFVPVGGPVNPSGPQSFTTPKQKSLKRQLREATETREALDAYIKSLEEKKKGDKKDEKKPDDGKGLNLLHMSMLLMMTAPFLGLFELYCLKIMAAALLPVVK